MGSNLMGQIVYVLCGLTSGACTVLLLGRYRKTKVDLLFWGAAAFFAFTATNILLYIDLVLFPNVDLGIVRNAITLGGIAVLLYGLIHNST